MVADDRAINNYRRRKFGHQELRVIAFVCECADDQCRRAVLLTPGEFDEARASGRPIVLDSDHVPPQEPHDSTR